MRRRRPLVPRERESTGMVETCTNRVPGCAMTQSRSRFVPSTFRRADCRHPSARGRRASSAATFTIASQPFRIPRDVFAVDDVALHEGIRAPVATRGRRAAGGRDGRRSRTPGGERVAGRCAHDGAGAGAAASTTMSAWRRWTTFTATRPRRGRERAARSRRTRRDGARGDPGVGGRRRDGRDRAGRRRRRAPPRVATSACRSLRRRRRAGAPGHQDHRRDRVVQHEPVAGVPCSASSCTTSRSAATTRRPCRDAAARSSARTTSR